jgi:uncharacterized protein YndB with AHSA1/START domain
MRGRRHERRDNAGAPRRAYGPLTQLSDAPCNLVWRAWTDPRHLAQWFGPGGFISSVPELDVRVGGSLRIVMRSGDDNDYPMKSEFREVVPPEQLVFSNIAVDNEDNHLLEGETTVNLKSKAIRPSSRCTLTPKVSFQSRRRCWPLWKRAGATAASRWRSWSRRATESSQRYPSDPGQQ